MMTDEQLIERIRAGLEREVAGVHPPADLLTHLLSAADARWRPRFRSRIGVSGVIAALGSVAVVVTVVVVFAALGHDRSAPTSGASTRAGVRGLIARMAVLRRPQTPADRLPTPVRAELRASPQGTLPFRFSIIPSLTRRAATIDAGSGSLAVVDIYVVVGKPAGYPDDIVTTVAVAGQPGHRHLLGIPEVVNEQAANATAGLSIGAVGSAGSRDGTRGVNVGVVPDGVTHVKWVFQRAGSPPVTVDPEVHNNVAVSKAAGLGVSRATWYGTGGRIIASYNQPAQRRAEAAAALAASARQPIAPAIKKHFTLFRRPIARPTTLKSLPYRTAAVIARQGYGLNITQARFVPYPGTPGLWVIPGARGIAMARLDRDGGADDSVPVSLALSGHMIASTDGATVWGLVPDGNPTVTVILASGATRTVRVIDNVYAITAHHKIASVIARNAAGHRTTISAPR